MLKKSDYLILASALISMILSIYLWFTFGIFMVGLFLAGLFITYREFKQIDPKKQQEEYSEQRDMKIEK